MTVIIDGEPSRKWVPFARSKQRMLKDLRISKKIYAINGYAIRVSTEPDFIKVTEPPRPAASWGDNSNGALGTGDDVHRFEPGLVKHRPAWVSLAVGQSYSMGIQSDTSLWVWGSDASYGPHQYSSGNMGLGDVIEQHSPKNLGGGWVSASGHYISLGVKVDGSLWAWGGNYVDSPPINSLEPVQVGTAKWRTAVAQFESVGIQEDGTLWELHLGLGYTTAAAVPEQIDSGQWVAVASGDYFALALREDGTLWSWTSRAGTLNTLPQLGLGSGLTAAPGVPTQVGTSAWLAIAAGNNHSLAIRDDGTLWSWGSAQFAQLGLGNYTNRFTPTQVGSAKWRAIAGGLWHSLGIQVDGSMWTWGGQDSTVLNTNGPPYVFESPSQVGQESQWRRIAAGPAFFVNLASFGWPGPPDTFKLPRQAGVVPDEFLVVIL